MFQFQYGAIISEKTKEVVDAFKEFQFQYGAIISDRCCIGHRPGIVFQFQYGAIIRQEADFIRWLAIVSIPVWCNY